MKYNFKCSVISMLFFSLIGLAPLAAFASMEDEDDLGIGQGKDGMDMQIDKAQVSEMLELMKAQGQISAEDAAKAQKELSQKSDADMQNLQKEAEGRIKSGNIPTLPSSTTAAHAPASVTTTETADLPAAAKTEQVIAPKAADDRSKNLKDAFQFINQ